MPGGSIVLVLAGKNEAWSKSCSLFLYGIIEIAHVKNVFFDVFEMERKIKQLV